MKIPQLIEKYKDVYGAYAAMALMNIRTVLNHIQNIIGIDGAMEERSEDYWEHPIMQYIKNPKFGDNLPEKNSAIMEMLMNCFPFVRIMADNLRVYDNHKSGRNRQETNLSDVHNVLNTAFRVLKKYRDYTCHYYINDSSWNDGSSFLKKESWLSIIVNKYYDVALRNTKERYNYSTEQLAFIQDKRYSKQIGDYGKRKLVTNCEFFLSMQNSNNDIDKTPHLSAIGVAQLISFFLEKKYIKIFLSKIHVNGKIPAQSEECRIIMRSMSIHCIRLPKERIKSDKKEISIALDILNELKRCPKELFETLTFEKQCLFREVSLDHNEVLHMRSTDRFVQLSMQYIDYNKMFDKIRFHVNMGKLRYLFAPDKLCIDGNRRVRVIEHDINGYGRIGEIEEYRKNSNGNFGESNIEIRDFEKIKRDDADSNNYPYIVDTYSHYLLNNNKIEFCFTEEKIIPTIESFGGKWYVNKKMPSCRMSTLELPAMMFHMHLLGSKQTEKHIIKTYNNYVELFEALRDGTLTEDNIDSFGIPRKDMPQKVLDAINKVESRKSYKECQRKSLLTLLEETEKLIAKLKADKKAVASKDNKMGRPGFRQISTGKLAKFLADDIVKFQPTLLTGDDYGIDRITGMNFRIMQAAIATYNCCDNEDFCTFYNMFKKARLVDGEKERNHPFLYSALYGKPRNTIEFYEKYLQARNSYLNKLTKRLDQGEKISLPFINIESNKWCKRDDEYYSVTGENFLDLPIELPRQMFDDEIITALKKMPQMSGINFDEANTTYLIAEYLKRVMNDDFQDFYSWRRNYKYIDLLQCITDTRNHINKQYTTTEERELIWKDRECKTIEYKEHVRKQRQQDIRLMRLSENEFESILQKRISTSKNDYQKTEKHIRRYKVQDALLFMIAKDILGKNIEFKAERFKLKDIIPNADKGILSEIMPIDFIFEKNNKKYIIHSDSIKLKNYGEFFVLANDKRIVSLLDIVSLGKINKEEIKQELDNYDNCRPDLVKLVFDFEKMAFDIMPGMRAQVDSGERIDFKYILNELSKCDYLNEHETWVLSQIRNAFNHNIYPLKELAETRTLPEIAEQLIKKFDIYTKFHRD